MCEKSEIANFSSQQKVFLFLNAIIRHVAVNAAVWSNPLIFLTH